jgi:hypothetical protein
MRYDAHSRIIPHALLAGAVLVAVFYLAMRGIPESDYVARDDGVITLSHARNLVDYGFIGVNPSGERVEGFSAPLHFLLFVPVYAATHADYYVFSKVFPYVFDFLFGALVFLIARELLAPALARRNAIAVALTAFTALVMAPNMPVMLWLHSGMENPITHAAYAYCLWVLLRGLRRGDVSPWHAIPFGFAALARDESIVHVGALLAAYLLAGFYPARIWRRPLLLAVLTCLVWALLVAAKAWYFGDLKPNTALAQELIFGLPAYQLLHGQAREVLEFCWRVCRANGVVLMLCALPLLLCVPLRRQPLGPLFILVAGALSVVLHLLLFGPARLEESRTTTFLAVYAALFLVTAIAANVNVNGGTGLRVAASAYLLLLLLPFAQRVYATPVHGPICCRTDDFEIYTRGTLLQLQEQQRLPRPLVSNPDLGVLSFAKDFNIIDAGLLGSTPLAHGVRDREFVKGYYLRAMVPDFIALHEAWLCTLIDVFQDPRFARQFVAVRPPFRVFGHGNGLRVEIPDIQALGQSQCTMPVGIAPFGLYVRRDIMLGSPSAERELIDRLNLSPDPAVLARAIDACNRTDLPDGCMYVVRSAYRFLPEFIAADREREMLAAVDGIANAGQRRVALAILAGRRHGQLKPELDAFLAAPGN